MPNRSTLNKYELLVTEIRRLAKKKELDIEEMLTKEKAMLVAALSSNHSWKTSKFLHDGGDFDKDSISNETAIAFNEGWKNVTENDIEEVVNSNINDHTFSMWLHYIVSKEERQKYHDMLNALKAELVDGLEPIEKLAD